MEELSLRVENVSKEYRLGAIGGNTLKNELQSKFAKLRHKEDPNLKIGEKAHEKNERFLALDDVSFEIKKGERIGIIGHNGAGKSTLLKLICRVTAPSTGTICMNGRITSMLEVGTGFHGELTGRENIYLNGAILGMSKAEIDKKYEEIVEFSEVKQFIDTPIKRYSSGMKVKLGFSVASHLNSEIMIMDEVLAVGDMAFQKKCIEQMRKVSVEEGRTILYVSHNMNTIRQLCDRCIVLDHGHVIFDGEPDEAIHIYLGTTQTSDNYLRTDIIERENKFFGKKICMSEMNILNGDKSEFAIGSKIRCKISYIAEKRMDDLFFRVVVRDADGTPVTMFYLNEAFDCTEGINDIVFNISLGKIVPEKYALTFVVYQVDKFGNDLTLDVLRDVYWFEIKNIAGFNHNMRWEPKYWGHFFGEPIELEQKT